MRFNDPTLYGRDDESDEYSDSGAFGGLHVDEGYRGAFAHKQSRDALAHP